MNNELLLKIEKFNLEKYKEYLNEYNDTEKVNIFGGYDPAYIVCEDLSDSTCILSKRKEFDERGELLYIVDKNNGDCVRPKSMYLRNFFIRISCKNIEKGTLVCFYKNGKKIIGMFDFIGKYSSQITQELIIVKNFIDTESLEFGYAIAANSSDGTCELFNATAEECEWYMSQMLKIGYRFDSNGNIHFIPCVGMEYWTVEMRNGKFFPMKNEPPKSEEERPIKHDRCFKSFEEAKKEIARLNQEYLPF